VIWFMPTTSGDFRLAPLAEAPDEQAVLTIDKPTPAERCQLNAFILQARERDWIDVGEGYSRDGLTRLVLRAPAKLAGPVLAAEVFRSTVDLTAADAPIWTAIRSHEGTVSLLNGRNALDLTQLDGKAAEDDEAEATAQSDPAAAVTLRKPKRGCPEPLPVNRRASQVLRAFCTASQIREWETHGYLHALGSLTGRRYRIHHPTVAARAGLNRVMVDLDTREQVCVYDESVPAEEQALSLKFLIEHEEAAVFSRAYRMPL
jgi:hypothetical protein